MSFLLTAMLWCVAVLVPPDQARPPAIGGRAPWIGDGVYVYLAVSREYPIKTRYVSTVIWIPVSAKRGETLGWDETYRGALEAAKESFVKGILEQYDESPDGFSGIQIVFPPPFNHREGPTTNSELLERTAAKRKEVESSRSNSMRHYETAYSYRVRNVLM
jgi:hypothetical protein